jgi:hypothetical protein
MANDYYEELAAFKEMKVKNPESCGNMKKPVLGSKLATWVHIVQRQHHSRGSINPQRIKRLEGWKILDLIGLSNRPARESCLMGKQQN